MADRNVDVLASCIYVYLKREKQQNRHKREQGRNREIERRISCGVKATEGAVKICISKRSSSGWDGNIISVEAKPTTITN